MTKELIERLRYISSHAGSGSATNTVCEAAINAIESLQGENAALKSQRDMWESMFVEVRAERDALAAKLVTLEADAERYRHIRQSLLYVGPEPSCEYGKFIEYDNFNTDPYLLDAAIDAAKGGQHEDA